MGSKWMQKKRRQKRSRSYQLELSLAKGRNQDVLAADKRGQGLYKRNLEKEEELEGGTNDNKERTNARIYIQPSPGTGTRQLARLARLTRYQEGMVSCGHCVPTYQAFPRRRGGDPAVQCHEFLGIIVIAWPEQVNYRCRTELVYGIAWSLCTAESRGVQGTCRHCGCTNVFPGTEYLPYSILVLLTVRTPHEVFPLCRNK